MPDPLRCHAAFEVTLIHGEIPEVLQVEGEGVGLHAARVDAEHKVRAKIAATGARLWSMVPVGSTYDPVRVPPPEVRHRGWRPRRSWRRRLAIVVRVLFT